MALSGQTCQQHKQAVLAMASS